MNNQFFLERISALIYITLIVFLIGDILRKIALFYNLDFVRYTAVSKGFILFSYIIFIIVFFKKYNQNIYSKRLIYFTIILSVSFVIGQFSLKDFSGLTNISSRNLLIFGRYIFWLISTIVFIPLLIDAKHYNKHLSFLENIIVVNAFVIIISCVFDIYIFKTYSNPQRFGYMGIFNTHNQASYYYMVFILYYYYRVYFNNEKQIKILLFLILASVFIGTKKLYLFLVILGTYHFFHFAVWKKKYFYLKMATIITVIIIFYSQIKAILNRVFALFFEIYNDKGIITVITSFRNELLVETVNNTIRENWTFINFIVGGPRFHETRTEFGLVDLYLFFGFIGIFVFYYLFKTLYYFTRQNKFYLFILVVVFLVSILASGFLPSANQPIMFLLITGYFITKKSQNT